jgi:hypothetical protein
LAALSVLNLYLRMCIFVCSYLEDVSCLDVFLRTPPRLLFFYLASHFCFCGGSPVLIATVCVHVCLCVCMGGWVRTVFVHCHCNACLSAIYFRAGVCFSVVTSVASTARSSALRRFRWVSVTAQLCVFFCIFVVSHALVSFAGFPTSPFENNNTNINNIFLFCSLRIGCPQKLLLRHYISISFMCIEIALLPPFLLFFCFPFR